ncbi:MAG: Na+/H+ antiporter NhaC [Bacteroidetes Order II. Incertae sedis bacterium]|nr:Na+/H+ antiporter NhaC [Bacteroidetes Order II. bacterium]
MSETKKTSTPSLWHSLIPIFVLIGLLSSSVLLFGDGSSSGPNQIALILSAMVAAIIGLRSGHTWNELQEGMVHGVSLAMGAIFILLIVGALIGTWILSGIVPSMIYYGLKVLDPSYFYAATVIICSMTSLATGSSWTTASTVGIALVGISGALQLSPAVTAGAIISGAYFGDKLSPLSDTTNLAPAMAGTDLFTHVRHMLWTTIPSLAIALIIFAVMGLMAPHAASGGDLNAMLSALEQNFSIGPHLFLGPALVFFLIYKKMPAFPALLIGALAGGVMAMIFQPTVVQKFADSPELGGITVLFKGVWKSLFSPFTIDSGNEALDNLLSRGGMSSMLNTIWLILSAMIFGAVMEKTEMLEVIANKILSMAKSTGGLITATLITSLGMNIVASDQYIAIVLPGRMYRAEFARRKLHPKNLSRALEDAGTLTSPLVPWNTCGAFMATTLGVATFAYLPYCFFNLLNPVISSIYGYTGFTIEKLEEEATTA